MTLGSNVALQSPDTLRSAIVDPHDPSTAGQLVQAFVERPSAEATERMVTV